MTQREKLIELVDKAIISARDNYGMPFSEDIADFLMGHGVVVFDEDVIDRRNLPLISHLADKPINVVLKLIKAEENGDIIRLTFKPEETVYVLVYNGIEKTKIDRIVIDEHGMSIVTNVGCWFPEQMVYKTREEAEEALEKEREKQRRWQTVEKLVKRALEKSGEGTKNEID